MRSSSTAGTESALASMSDAASTARGGRLWFGNRFEGFSEEGRVLSTLSASHTQRRPASLPHSVGTDCRVVVGPHDGSPVLGVVIILPPSAPSRPCARVAGCILSGRDPPSRAADAPALSRNISHIPPPHRLPPRTVTIPPPQGP